MLGSRRLIETKRQYLGRTNLCWLDLKCYPSTCPRFKCCKSHGPQRKSSLFVTNVNLKDLSPERACDVGETPVLQAEKSRPARLRLIRLEAAIFYSRAQQTKSVLKQCGDLREQQKDEDQAKSVTRLCERTLHKCLIRIPLWAKAITMATSTMEAADQAERFG